MYKTSLPNCDEIKSAGDFARKALTNKEKEKRDETGRNTEIATTNDESFHTYIRKGGAHPGSMGSGAVTPC